MAADSEPTDVEPTDSEPTESGHKVGRSTVMTASDWDGRYAEGRQWSVEPNRFFAEVATALETGDGPSGRKAVDLACGEGRNAVWLAERGWDVTAVDFSAVGVERGRVGASERGIDLAWTVADLETWDMGSEAWDLVAHVYLHWGPDQREPLLRRCAEAVAVGGALVVVGHDRSNIEHGHGGPQNPDLLTTPDELRDLLSACGVDVTRSELVYRDLSVVGEDGVEIPVRAIDHVVVARRR